MYPARWARPRWLLAAFLLALGAPGGAQRSSDVAVDTGRTGGCSLLTVRTVLHSEASGELAPPGSSARAADVDGGRADGRERAATRAASHSPALVDVGKKSSGRSGNRWAQPAGWFGDFSDGESTFNADGLNDHLAQADRLAAQGDYSPDLEGASAMPVAKPPMWFEESKSGGPLRAWQTFYPSVEDMKETGHNNGVPWRVSPRGAFQQPFEPSRALSDHFRSFGGKGAAWFDAAAEHRDIYGRARRPGRAAEESRVEWEQRSMNASLACAQPGCSAFAALQVVNRSSELHQKCTLDITIRVTDFDDEFSREYVELVSLNGHFLYSRCHPGANGCSVTGKLPEHSCMAGFPLDNFIGEDGMLNITARLSPMVDECPIDGNLLSGTVLVTCFVQPQRERSPAPGLTARLGEPTPNQNTTVSNTTKLQCETPGCVANATVLLRDEDIILNRTCRLTVTVIPTDFDGGLASSEEVEWVAVEGRIVKEHLVPGGNPCKNGTQRDRQAHTILDELVPSYESLDGRLEVAAKISNMVDECGNDGFLLDMDVLVNCT